MFGKINILALIFHGVFISLCSLGGVTVIAQSNPAANKNPGFINIDCGVTEDYLDDERQMWYQTDSRYIDSGENMEVSPEIKNRNIQLMGKNLRSFPHGRRNCYTLRPRKGENQTYLIRATFLYGNYDGKNQIPRFDLHIGVSKWVTVLLQNASSFTHNEINIAPPEGDVQVCLVNTGHGTPFINGLELRILENSLYQPGPGALRTWWRINIGTQMQTIRYPDDDYDRIWEGVSHQVKVFDYWSPVSNGSIFSTNHTNDRYKVPNKVLMTAATSPNASTPLSHRSYEVDATTTTWHMYLHFAEIQRHEDGVKRRVKVSANNRTTEAITLEYAKPMTLFLQLYGNAINFSIYAAEGSNLPPIINAIELFRSIDLPNKTTLISDVDAITNIKQTYAVPKDWQGDPCVPKNFTWESINCSYNVTPRIVSLNLSFCNLMGEISTSFSELDQLHTLDLSYNGLSGALPEFLSELSNLKILYLIGNNLIGPIPPTLKNKFRDGSLDLRLAGNPLCQKEHCEEDKKSTKKRPLIPIIASTVSAVIFFIILCALLLFWKFTRREGHPQEEGLIKSKNRPFRYNEVLQITGNLNTIIGEGGFGKVYLGDLTNGIKVAVKLLAETSMQGHREFQAEAQLLMIVHHKNLVTLIGYCRDGGKMALLYEYMANGSLRQHLSETTTKVLSWNQRLQIAIDAAQGLEYLHNGCKPAIVHRDLKPSNILLDENMRAKIADFGMSKAFLTESTTHVTTRIGGTIGYVDPEFQVTSNLNKASDVYSFGIILFELITGRSAIISRADESISIVDWVNPLIHGGDIRKVVDPKLHGEFGISSAWKVVEIAMSCTLIPGTQRPDMSVVLAELKQCLAIQMGSENLYGVGNSSTYSNFTDNGACLDSEAFSLISAR